MDSLPGISAVLSQLKDIVIKVVIVFLRLEYPTETSGSSVKPLGRIGASVLEQDLLLCIRNVSKVIVNHQ